MPALSFKKQFADLVAEGKKNHTIRAKRKLPIKEGDTLYLYCAQRSTQGYRIGKSVCTKIQPIEIWLTSITKIEIFLDGKIVPPTKAQQLAKDDGFPDLTSLRGFFFPSPKDGILPPHFIGDLIHWKPLNWF
ncbi:ASCH domain-containing protein [Picosynechococcus sp. PCC 8807]|uniref:ASCH domain-containing protein n=1 Tax=Picosynechococcus sp. PCC 8807 TaxID=195248 RepID=UPI0008104240|nr:ASCH domain-containing protein [Picosynechococcus sp. PCC 8807]ANV92017.1 hypothetical protein AWQ24_14655 [Picosynechococcus sp. PCC 8807]